MTTPAGFPPLPHPPNHGSPPPGSPPQPAPARLSPAPAAQSPVLLPPPPVQPPPSPGRDRRAVALAVLTVLLLLAVGGGTAWWVRHADEGSPLADRPRVTDRKAGISYALPEGWQESGAEDLIDAFNSAISGKHPDGSGNSMVFSGSTGAVPESTLEAEAKRAAKSNAVFFYPDGGSEPTESTATTVSGLPAHTVALRTRTAGGDRGHLRLTLIAVDDERAAFLLGVAQPGGAEERRQVDTVMESASVGEGTGAAAAPVGRHGAAVRTGTAAPEEAAVSGAEPGGGCVSVAAPRCDAAALAAHGS